MKAHEVDQQMNYGERDGKNVIDTAEYQRNLIHIGLFKWLKIQTILRSFQKYFISNMFFIIYLGEDGNKWFICY